MEKEHKRCLKRIAAAALVMLMVSGTVPFQPIAEVFDTAITASAAEYNGGSVYVGNLGYGDVIKAETIITRNNDGNYSGYTLNGGSATSLDVTFNEDVVYTGRYLDDGDAFVVQFVTALSGSGTADAPYQIGSLNDLNVYLNNAYYSGAYIELTDDVSVTGGLTIAKDSTLTIPEGKTLTVNGGINAQGHTVTVTGAGTLNVYGANGADGAHGDSGNIGGSGDAGFIGNLIIDGATVTATGGNGGKGGGSDGTGADGGSGGSGVLGDVTVNSGSLEASGGNGGNGGRAMDGGNGGNGGSGVSGDVIVNGSSITVSGGNGGNGGSSSTQEQGFGFGEYGNAGSAGRAVGGTITATTIQESNDNNTWSDISGTTSTKQYVRAESPAVTYEKHDAVAATYEADGNIEYYTDESDNKYTFDGTTYTPVADVTIPKLTVYTQANINTGSSGNVDLNLAVPIPDGADPDEYRIRFGDTEMPVTDCDTVDIEGRTHYLLKVTAPAKNMTDEYAFALLKNGEVQTNGTTSIRQYADTVIGGNYGEDAQKVCRAMLAYGSAAQTFFNYNTDDLANKNNDSGEGADYSTVEIPNAVFDKDGLNAALAGSGLEYAGMSLTLKSDTYITLAFKVTSGTQDAAIEYVNSHFTLGGESVVAEKNGTKYVTIKTDAIAINNLMNNITLTCNSQNVTVNAAQYMNLANKGSDENLKNVCKALYNYYLCATAQ